MVLTGLLHGLLCYHFTPFNMSKCCLRIAQQMEYVGKPSRADDKRVRGARARGHGHHQHNWDPMLCSITDKKTLTTLQNNQQWQEQHVTEASHDLERHQHNCKCIGVKGCRGVSGPPLRSGEGAFRVRRLCPSGVRFSACPGAFRDVLRCVSGPPHGAATWSVLRIRFAWSVVRIGSLDSAERPENPISHSAPAWSVLRIRSPKSPPAWSVLRIRSLDGAPAYKP